MWIQSSNKDTNGCPFSYAVSGSDNELLLYNHKNLALWVGGKSSRYVTHGHPELARKQLRSQGLFGFDRGEPGKGPVNEVDL